MSDKNIKIYKLQGMHCPSCAMLIESELEDNGINVKVSFAKETIEIEEGKDIKNISKIINKLGYNLET